MFEFETIARDRATRARAGRFVTPHGIVETPAFMPVGTQGSVKALDPAEIREVGSRMILANTYHLALRPGADLIARLGGLHQFMGWPGPILTDSGGFQVWSLGRRAARSPLVRIDENGVSFRSHLDGAAWRLTPESAIDLQSQIGADVVMAFDECTPGDASEAYARSAAERTHRWARRCRDRWQACQSHRAVPQALFGIVQGGNFRDLRRWSAETILSLDLPGIAVGGESIGFSKEQTTNSLDWVADLLPNDRPRYAMGVGDPVDFLTIVERGIDLFDSVYPTRLARNGALLHPGGRLRIVSARYRSDERPIAPTCRCLACRKFSRAYLHHLLRAGELLGHRLATLHNLTYCHDLVAELRQALVDGTLDQFRQRRVAPPIPPGE
ncbi:MAG: tRNA guanosine(34) transglycosylase Tgt [Chloroflexota bacterium]